MSLSTNQLYQTPTKGQPDLAIQPTVFSVQADTAVSAPLVPGQCVKVASTTGGDPKVLDITATTDEIFAVVAYNLKNATFPAYSYLEVFGDLSVLYMEASGAITRGAKVMPVITGSKIATATAGNSTVGVALDAAAADGDLIRVLIKLSSASQDTNQAVFVAQITTPNATDLASAEALANQLKTTVNATLTSLINAGLMAAS